MEAMMKVNLVYVGCYFSFVATTIVEADNGVSSECRRVNEE